MSLSSIARTTARCFSLIAEVLHRQGRIEWARAACRMGLICDNDSVELRRLLALATCDGEHYRSILSALHRALHPRVYLEIGTLYGETLELADKGTFSIAVDPRPQINRAFSNDVTIFAETSNCFFRRWDDRPGLSWRKVDLTFIDGLHLFEQALEDFFNAEMRSAPGAVIVLHDVLPADERTASRAQHPDWWTGDVWKMIPALRKYRPDLQLILAAAAPTGLLIVTSVSPPSQFPRENVEQIAAEFASLDFGWYQREIAAGLDDAARTSDEVLRRMRAT